jgi:hypothetical protein
VCAVDLLAWGARLKPVVEAAFVEGVVYAPLKLVVVAVVPACLGSCPVGVGPVLLVLLLLLVGFHPTWACSCGGKCAVSRRSVQRLQGLPFLVVFLTFLVYPCRSCACSWVATLALALVLALGLVALAAIADICFRLPG